MAKSIPLTVFNRPAAPVAIDARDLAPAREPLPPTDGEKHTELSAVHDFAGKFRQPALVERLRQYVRHQSEVRRAIEEGHDPPPASALTDAAPVSINLDLTTGCNYACDHCVDMDILNQPFKFKHESLLESLRIMAERGLRSVIVIGGGEPTLYRRFEEIIRYMKSLDLRIAVVSNGSGQAKIARIADCLDEEDWVRLSLDSGHDRTFQAMHKPKRLITLEEICEAVPGIKDINDKFQFGFSFIITWKGAFINDTKIVENLDEIVLAAELARKNRFDYISVKPFLTRAPENNAEIVDLQDTDSHFEHVLSRIRQGIDRAKRLQTDRFRVVESTNLRVLENGTHRDYMQQPQQCHMQFFRQVLSPLGLYNCPVYRNQPQGRISDKDGCADLDRFHESVRSTASLIRTFDASHECRQVTCLYNHVNWWIEGLIRDPAKLDDLHPDPDREPDYFF
ncbi:MAG: radical SAM protein [Planctomycetota bacterium]|jgi:MoaA/NifB/PqqE/SkfB family radical SAM enzyme